MSVEVSVRGMQKAIEAAHLEIENIGGIDQAELTIPPGVTVLSGRNATNRTSLLRALMGALGSEDVSLKGDADGGHVELQIDGETHTRTLQRKGTTVEMGGDPYLEDPTLADLFAFLLESNVARRAVVRDDDLHEVMMRPVDTDEIEAEIARLRTERDGIDDELERIEEEKRRLTDLESRRTDLTDRIEAKREELAEVEAEVDDADVDPQRRQEEQRKLEEKLEELRSRRSDLEDVRYRIETERESIESLRSERADIRDELDDLTEVADGGVDELDAEVERLRDEKDELENEITDLQNVSQFNENVMEGDTDVVAPTAGNEDNAGSVTDQLLPNDRQVVCWTCGSEVDADRIEDTIDALRDRLNEKLAESRDLNSRIDELSDRRRELREEHQRRDRLTRKLDDLENEIEQRKSRIDELQDRRTDLSRDVEDLEAEVDELESEDFEEVLELHRTANEIEFDLERLTGDRAEIESEIESIESRLEEAEDLRDRRDEIAAELEELRTRVERLEREAVEAFNDQMDAVLDVLDYQNIARIWIERTERTVREGRRKTTETSFDLHVVRRTPNGSTYEDTAAHLSESEREVTGLVFALAGYLVHDVDEELPFILIDSVEAIDASRIAELVDHFRQRPDYLVVALLEEDAQVLEESDVAAAITEF